MDPKTRSPKLSPDCRGWRWPLRPVLALAIAGGVGACGGNDTTAPPAVDVPITGATGVASLPSQGRPAHNPVAAGTHVFDSAQGQPIPALTPVMPGSAPVSAAPSAAGQALVALTAASAAPAAEASASGLSAADSARAIAPPQPDGPISGTIIVTPGLVTDRERTPKPRLDRSSRP